VKSSPSLDFLERSIFKGLKKTWFSAMPKATIGELPLVIKFLLGGKYTTVFGEKSRVIFFRGVLPSVFLAEIFKR